LANILSFKTVIIGSPQLHRRNFYQSVQIYHDCAIMEAWLPFHDIAEHKTHILRLEQYPRTGTVSEAEVFRL